ncbi:MAG: 2'-5' RNA ligase family protein [Cyclobacteriaceae bacterium]|nr:2'-5' RNA ligase family protein [Cyclobacteriaceae bacterium]
MHSKESLYFLAAIPPAPLRNELYELKREFAQQYKSSKALNSPAHITLVPPFGLEAGKVVHLTDAMQLVAPCFDPFILQIDGFGVFAPKVVYLRIDDHPALRRLQASLFEVLKPHHGQVASHKVFIPHITLANRDLAPEMFELAWQQHKTTSYKRPFMLDSISLLKHNGHRWEVEVEVALGKIFSPT